MGYFDRDKRFDELFGEWFDEDFQPWLARQVYWHRYSYASARNPCLQAMAEAYSEVNEKIDSAILKMREQVDREFEDWKEERKLLEQEEQ